MTVKLNTSNMILKIGHIFVIVIFLTFTKAATIRSDAAQIQSFLAQNLLNIEEVSSDFSASEQSHYIEVTQGAIFMEQNMTFGTE